MKVQVVNLLALYMVPLFVGSRGTRLRSRHVATKDVLQRGRLLKSKQKKEQPNSISNYSDDVSYDPFPSGISETIRGDSYYRSYGVLTTPIAPPTQPPKTVTYPPMNPPTLPPLTAKPTSMPHYAPTQPPIAQPYTTEEPSSAPSSSYVVLTIPTAAPTQPPKTVTYPPMNPPTLPPLTAKPTSMPHYAPTQPPTAQPYTTVEPSSVPSSSYVVLTIPTAPSTQPPKAVTYPPTLMSHNPSTQPPPTQPPTTENPILAPTSSSVSNFVTEAKSDIASLISSDPLLAPKFVRMGFHDCIGGCDGCIDLNDPGNKGLDIPINALDSIVQKYTIDQTTGLTRSDIFALAALTAADVSQGTVNRVDFPFTWVGRVNCEDITEKRDMPSDMPSPHFNTSGMLNYFNTHFGFDARETVALMGAHTLGSANRDVTGFHGKWVNDNRTLSNSYYQNLVGGSGGLSDSVETMAVTTNWTDHLIEDTAQWQWEQNGLIMLNADIALVRDFQGKITEDGEVTCPFAASTLSSQAACPFASVTGKFVAQYKNDEALWLNDFRDVFTAMLLNGYDTSVPCEESICKLKKK